MTTNEFVLAAKQAIIETVEDEYGERYSPDDIQSVWLCHILGNKKGLFIDNGRNTRYYEVTWNAPLEEMYLDMYEKKENRRFDTDQAEGLLERAKQACWFS